MERQVQIANCENKSYADRRRHALRRRPRRRAGGQLQARGIDAAVLHCPGADDPRRRGDLRLPVDAARAREEVLSCPVIEWHRTDRSRRRPLRRRRPARRLGDRLAGTGAARCASWSARCSRCCSSAVGIGARRPRPRHAGHARARARGDGGAHQGRADRARRRYDATVTFADGRVQTYALAGDDIYVDAHIVKWTPLANQLGLHTTYRLDRIGGRYRNAGAGGDVAAHHPPARRAGRPRHHRHGPAVPASREGHVRRAVRVGHLRAGGRPGRARAEGVDERPAAAVGTARSGLTRVSAAAARRACTRVSAVAAGAEPARSAQFASSRTCEGSRPRLTARAHRELGQAGVMRKWSAASEDGRADADAVAGAAGQELAGLDRAPGIQM